MKYYIDKRAYMDIEKYLETEVLQFEAESDDEAITLFRRQAWKWSDEDEEGVCYVLSNADRYIATFDAADEETRAAYERVLVI